MHTKSTLRCESSGRDLSVDTLVVDVFEGPDAGKKVTTESERICIGTAEGNDLMLGDQTVSRYHLELERGLDGIVVRDLDSTNGTFVGEVRIREGIVPAGTVLKIGRAHLRVGVGSPVKVDLHDQDHLGQLWGRTEGMRRLMAQIERAAKTEAAILVIGESGTGKELIARALHELSPRGDEPFVTVDCGSLSPNLVASELFGHERGAFTGADRQHVGAFERADGGTLFLDEVGELPTELQPNLLGALERRRFRRVGGRSDISVNVRVVAATNRDLRAEVNAGRFRLDLYYRLAVVSLRVPPLRERRDDIPVLIEHFLREAGETVPIDSVFSESLINQLRQHPWPGNVRELRNVVEATLAMGEALLPPPVHEDSEFESASDGRSLPLTPLLSLSYKEGRNRLLADFERRYIEHWLELTGGNVARAAREAQMDRSHLFHLIRRHGLR